MISETEILDQVREIVALKPRRLDMGQWHGQSPCGTAHCLAGWAQEISGELGEPQEVGRKLLPKTAAMPGFFCSDTIARAWLGSRGYADDAEANAFRDRLIGLGWKHLTGELEEISGGVVRAYGSSKVETVSGGKVWAYGSSKVETVSGGVVRLRSSEATIASAKNCTVITETWHNGELIETDRKVFP